MSDESTERRIAEAVAVFAKDIGTWDIELTVTPAPGAPSVIQRATSENRMLGGRWLIVDYRAESGFEGHGVYGWDDAKRSYVGTWVDSMQSSAARATGTWDPKTRTMTFLMHGTHQGRNFRYREVTQLLEDGVQLHTNLVPTPDGGEFEMIRATYRRRSR